MPLRRAALLLAAFLAFPGLPAIAGTTVAHGYAAYGDLKYPAGFRHFDYVNPAAPKGGTLRLAGHGTFDTLNPYTLKNTSPFNSPGLFMYGFGELNETLLAGSGDYAPSGDEPASAYGLLAESIEYPADLAWVLFRLRPQARFHDGHPVDSADVVFSFNTLLRDGHPRFRDMYRDVAKVEAVDARSVRFSFRTRGDRLLPLRVGELPVLPQHWWEKRRFDAALLEPPLLSGPYRVASVEPGRRVVYARVADYWGRELAVNRGRWNFDRVQVDFWRDQTVALQAFMAGEYDIQLEYIARNWASAYDTPPVRDGRIVRELLPHRLPAPNQAFFINSRRELFRDRRVREALALLYDFEWSNANLFHGAYTRSAGWFPNSPFTAGGLPGKDELALLAPLRAQLPPALFTTPFALPRSKGDGNMRDALRKAQALLAAAGWQAREGRLVHTTSGQPFRFEILLSDASHSRILLPWVDNLRKAGIKASLRALEPTAYKVQMDRHDFDVTLAVLSNSLTPGHELREYLHSALADLPGGRNYAGVRLPAVDTLVDAALAAGTRAQLATRMQALDRVLQREYFIIPGWYLPYHRAAWWNRYGRPQVTPAYIAGFQDWYMATPAAANKKNTQGNPP